jgi:hypothetical protein
MRSRVYVLFLAFFVVTQALAHEEAGESNQAGPGKAVEAFDEHDGFKLSAKAIAAFDIKFAELKGPAPWRVPKSAIVFQKQTSGVYRKDGRWIQITPITIVEREKDFFLIRSEKLKTGTEIATSGTSFLRMTDADLNAGEADHH